MFATRVSMYDKHKVKHQEKKIEAESKIKLTSKSC